MDGSWGSIGKYSGVEQVVAASRRDLLPGSEVLVIYNPQMFPLDYMKGLALRES